MKFLHKIKKAAIALLAAGLFMVPQTAMASVAVLCYHELDRANDSFALSSSAFDSQIQELKDMGYRFISLDEYIAYTKGEISLPEKTVMLTFDDGYESFYQKAYPILKKHNVPAMFALVGSWMDGLGTPRDVRAMASWDEVREMEASGLVTAVSHSYNMHKQMAIDPQGDLSGVAASRLYLGARYETDEEYAARLANDMRATQEMFVRELGHKAKAMVWPYGLYSGEAIKAALDSGMEGTFLLDGGINEQSKDNLVRAKRMIMVNDTTGDKFKKMLTATHDEREFRSKARLAQVDIDSIYDKDPATFKRNLENMVKRLEDNRINLVAVQAFADEDGDGNVDAVYFPNSVLPVKADVFTAVVSRLLQTSPGIETVAWMPGLAYPSLSDANRVESKGEAGWYKRLSPFDEASVKKVEQLYRDLGKNTPVEGVLFQDDLYLNDFEDYSAAAKAAYRKKFGKSLDDLNKNDKAAMNDWTKFKTERLDEISMRYAAAFKDERPSGVIMRDIYAEPVTDPKSEEWFAQNYADYLNKYDFTVVMAYPYMDEADDVAGFMQNLAAAIKKAGGEKKTIVKVQTYDWSKERWLARHAVNEELSALKRAGIVNLGYYPEGVFAWK